MAVQTGPTSGCYAEEQIPLGNIPVKLAGYTLAITTDCYDMRYSGRSLLLSAHVHKVHMLTMHSGHCVTDNNPTSTRPQQPAGMPIAVLPLCCHMQYELLNNRPSMHQKLSLPALKRQFRLFLTAQHTSRMQVMWG